MRGGFKCSGCGAIQSFRDIQFESFVKGKRLMFSSSHVDSYSKGTVVCPDCVAKELNDKPEVVFTSVRECEWCHTQKRCTSFPRDNRLKNHIHFGSGWWNGHHICQDCLNEGIVKREGLTSSIHVSHKGEMYMLNEIGLRVKE